VSVILRELYFAFAVPSEQRVIIARHSERLVSQGCRPTALFRIGVAVFLLGVVV
jgi:hypothetical protein